MQSCQLRKSKNQLYHSQEWLNENSFLHYSPKNNCCESYEQFIGYLRWRSSDWSKMLDQFLGHINPFMHNDVKWPNIL